jgi:hypothetical protein
VAGDALVAASGLDFVYNQFTPTQEILVSKKHGRRTQIVRVPGRAWPCGPCRAKKPIQPITEVA